MRQNPHVRICGGPGSATTLVYPTASGRWARRRHAHDDGRDRLREGVVYPMGILITYVRGDRALVTG